MTTINNAFKVRFSSKRFYQAHVVGAALLVSLTAAYLALQFGFPVGSNPSALALVYGSALAVVTVAYIGVALAWFMVFFYARSLRDA